MKKLVLFLFLCAPFLAQAESPEQILAQLQAHAGASASADRGRQLYLGKFNGEKAASCSACHTPDAKAAGRHVRTHKVIDPLAPSVNPERFADMAKVEKWFKRNCNEVLNRACTAQEKVDFAAYILSLK